LGAWLAKIASDPPMAMLALKTIARRRPAMVRHLRSTAQRTAPSATVKFDLPADIGSGTWRFIAAGAWGYLGMASRRRLFMVNG
jgi:hypothetical protein